MSPRSPLLVWAAGPLYWLLIAPALWLLLRGHNEPGGGFIAGLVAVAASSLLALTRDVTAARRWQPLAPMPLAMLGVGLAALAGLPGVLGGQPFLSHLWLDSGLSTVLLFDLGVFCAVWGALTGYLYPLLNDQPLESSPQDDYLPGANPRNNYTRDDHQPAADPQDKAPQDANSRADHSWDNHLRSNQSGFNQPINDHTLDYPRGGAP